MPSEGWGGGGVSVRSGACHEKGVFYNVLLGGSVCGEGRGRVGIEGLGAEVTTFKLTILVNVDALDDTGTFTTRRANSRRRARMRTSRRTMADRGSASIATSSVAGTISSSAFTIRADVRKVRCSTRGRSIALMDVGSRGNKRCRSSGTKACVTACVIIPGSGDSDCAVAHGIALASARKRTRSRRGNKRGRGSSARSRSSSSSPIRGCASMRVRASRRSTSTRTVGRLGRSVRRKGIVMLSTTRETADDNSAIALAGKEAVCCPDCVKGCLAYLFAIGKGVTCYLRSRGTSPPDKDCMTRMLSDGGGLRGILCCNCNKTKSLAKDCLSKGARSRGCICARVTTDCTCTKRTKFAKYGCGSLMGTKIVTCVGCLFKRRRPPGNRLDLSDAGLGTMQSKGVRGAPGVALSKSREGCIALDMPRGIATRGLSGKADIAGKGVRVCNKSAFCLSTSLLLANDCTSNGLCNSIKGA